MDLVEDKGSRLSDRSTGSNPESDVDQPRSCVDLNQPRSCVDCKTTKTPLWRAGPNGPKSLCNACGIRYKKKKKAAATLTSKELVKMKNNTKMGVPTLGSKELGKMKNTTKMGVSLQLVHMRSGIMKLKQGVLREEEEAAVLLMALSSGILCSAKN